MIASAHAALAIDYSMSCSKILAPPQHSCSFYL